MTSDQNNSRTSIVEPKQQRAKATYQALLTAAQEILATEGLYALNSNAVVTAADATPPTFYRYFKNKQQLLHVLGQRLMAVQNQELEAATADVRHDDYFGQILATLQATYEVTVRFRGAHALLLALRTTSELQHIRLESHNAMAAASAPAIAAARPTLSDDEVFRRARLGVELGYAAIEMLLELPKLDAARILHATANGTLAMYLADDQR
ncbi:MAG: TetR/AcrR family transcriptional regulator [Pseudomonadota bacterium]